MGYVNKVSQGFKGLKVTLPARGEFAEMTGRVTGVNEKNQTLYVTWDWEGQHIGQSYNCEKFETKVDTPQPGDSIVSLVLQLD